MWGEMGLMSIEGQAAKGVIVFGHSRSGQRHCDQGQRPFN